MSDIVFLTLFLGLTSGLQPVELQVSPAIRTVSITLDGHKIAEIRHAPWRAEIDLGEDLIPRSLEAIGYDEKSNEVARTRQILNLPRPLAEVTIVPRWERDKPVGVDLRWMHRYQLDPQEAWITVDGRPLKLDKLRHATLPELDMKVPHVIAAQLTFKGGAIARNESVIQGTAGYTDTSDAQLTAVAVNQRGLEKTEAVGDCFASEGAPLRTSTIEKSTALVVIVNDPDPAEARSKYEPAANSWGGDWSVHRGTRRKLQLDSDTTVRLLWSVSSTYAVADRIPMTIFEQSADTAASAGGMVWLLTRPGTNPKTSLPRRLADAVATAGVSAISDGRRRAVVLLLGRAADGSYYAPAAVRKYLASVGVPLLVWSLTGPRPELVASWGEVADVSTEAGLSVATARLREVIAAQRIAWITADPLIALRARATADCGFEPIATPWR